MLLTASSISVTTVRQTAFGFLPGSGGLGFTPRNHRSVARRWANSCLLPSLTEDIRDEIKILLAPTCLQALNIEKSQYTQIPIVRPGRPSESTTGTLVEAKQKQPGEEDAGLGYKILALVKFTGVGRSLPEFGEDNKPISVDVLGAFELQPALI